MDDYKIIVEQGTGTCSTYIEDERGSIKVGKYADFLLLNQDVLTCPVGEIHSTKPTATYFEGKKVYSE